MSGYKEFEGKTLDEAIQAPCSFYDTSREKLEIEICNDAKGGIFGLVGAKKARVRAKLVKLASVLDDLDAPLGVSQCGSSQGGNAKRQKKRPAEKHAAEESKSREEGKTRPER
jgi:spoIIIJ-associated protein